MHTMGRSLFFSMILIFGLTSCDLVNSLPPVDYSPGFFEDFDRMVKAASHPNELHDGFSEALEGGPPPSASSYQTVVLVEEEARILSAGVSIVLERGGDRVTEECAAALSAALHNGQGAVLRNAIMGCLESSPW